MLHATAKLLGVNFEEAGIAVLSAEGKGNLDKPYAIFRALGIPTYILWDCDKKHSTANLALLRLASSDNALAEAPCQTVVAANHAHFEDTLEALMKQELTPEIHGACLAAACEPFGLTPNEDNHKVPEVMYQVLTNARLQNGECPTLEALVVAIWLHLTGINLRAVDGDAEAAEAA